MTTARYWDSDCFIAWLTPEEEKAAACEPVIKAAERGELVIVTSVLTLTEVIHLRNKVPLRREVRDKIEQFFRHEWIVVRQIDRFLAEDARELFWDGLVDSKDAVHVATALKEKERVAQFDTFDDGLIRRNGSIGDPPLHIGRPNMPLQTTWLDDANVAVPEESATASEDERS
jgi:predicted nucleic acid-binding protein